jgi:hypothetical protein
VAQISDSVREQDHINTHWKRCDDANSSNSIWDYHQINTILKGNFNKRNADRKRGSFGKTEDSTRHNIETNSSTGNGNGKEKDPISGGIKIKIKVDQSCFYHEKYQ